MRSTHVEEIHTVLLINKGSVFSMSENTNFSIVHYRPSYFV